MTKYQKTKDNYIAKHGEKAWKEMRKNKNAAHKAKYIANNGKEAWDKKNREANAKRKARLITEIGQEEYNKRNYKYLQNWMRNNREAFNEIHRRSRKNNPESIARARRNWLFKLKSDPIRYEEYKAKRRAYEKRRRDDAKAA